MTNTLKRGDRIRLMAELDDDYAPIPAGTAGTVLADEKDAEQVDVDWDNGRAFCLLPTFDQFQVIGWVDLDKKKGLSIVDWFDPHNRLHLHAYAYFVDQGCWPEGFLPKPVEFPHLCRAGPAHQ